MSRGVWLEHGTAGDAVPLAALEAECFSHPWTEGQFRQELTSGGSGAVLVLRAADPAGPGGRRLVAYCVYRLVADEMHIMDIAVAPEWRRRGLAQWLLRVAMRKAARAGGRRALLEVRESNRAAQGLYAGLGFEVVGRRRDYYREPFEHAVVLAFLPLPALDP